MSNSKSSDISTAPTYASVTAGNDFANQVTERFIQAQQERLDLERSLDYRLAEIHPQSPYTEHKRVIGEILQWKPFHDIVESTLINHVARYTRVTQVCDMIETRKALKEALTGLEALLDHATDELYNAEFLEALQSERRKVSTCDELLNTPFRNPIFPTPPPTTSSPSNSHSSTSAVSGSPQPTAPRRPTATELAAWKTKQPSRSALRQPYSKGPSKTVSFSRTGRPFKPGVPLLDEKRGSPRSASPRSSSSNERLPHSRTACHRCHESGHFAKDCSLYKCKVCLKYRPGHYIRQCPERGGSGYEKWDDDDFDDSAISNITSEPYGAY
ncbi:hypothetical protein VNI00_010602 [Paramarasmius palmivorus]|uniref:CCHC-type domain-containing protein n=1 Tax=Paramarasmius palmivorus TaxID=297713 RepID=A0AAW0CM23_9AGAR